MKHILKLVVPALSIAFIAGFVFAHPATAGYEKIAYEPAPAPYAVDRQRKLALRYDVYAGGFRALNASLVMDLDKKAYDMALKAETQGFIGTLFPWKATFNTAGHANTKGALIPTIHTERSSWREKVSFKEMSYGPTGKILKTTTQSNGKTTTDRDINDVLSGRAVDVLTGALTMLQTANKNQKCTGKFPVFDGKRRYNITLSDNGTEILPPSRYSSFQGEAMRCTITVEPVAGFVAKDAKRGWMAVQNHTAERNKPPILWLARMKETGQVVPVRMEIASTYGSVVAHLSGGTHN